MALALLTTKLLFPPVRHGFVPRPGLIERLDTGLRAGCKLALVSAPAGYGKTTLLCEWHAGRGQDFPTAWLALDPSDSELTLFLRYLTAALGSLQADLVDGTAFLLQSPQPSPLDVVLTSLINDVSGFSDDFALILDDYHVIASPAVHDAMSFLLDHAPPQMHIVLLTREDPPLPLPKLRARGQMVEIREVDLRFSVEETAGFMANTMGVVLSQTEIADLVTQTEGWVAGLQMAALSVQGRDETQAAIAGFRGDDRYVMDYLMDEVFRRQPTQVQDWLLQTSILERLCASLCDAVSGADEWNAGSLPLAFASSQVLLEYLERANLFVLPLDNRREWYRYHHLFADLLRYRLQLRHPERVPGLQRRASRWYARNGQPDEAMQHALAIPDYDLAAELAEQFALQMIGGSRLGAYLNWVQQLPDDLVRQRAYLCAGCGWAHVLTHRTDTAVRYVEAGETALPDHEPVPNILDGRCITREEVHGHLAAIRSYADRDLGDPAAGIAHARQALELLPPESLAIRCAVALNLGFLYWDAGESEMARQAFGDAHEMAQASQENVYVEISALASLGSIAVLQGRLSEAEGLFRRAVQCGTSESGAPLPVPAAGLVHAWLALLHYQRDEIETAQQHLDAVLPAVERIGDPQAIVRTYVYQGLLDESRGEYGSAEDWLRRAEQMMQTHPVQDAILSEWIVACGQLHLARGDVPSVLSLLSSHEVTPTDLDDASAYGGARSQLPGSRVGRYLLLARVMLAQGTPGRAAELLEKVCAIAEGYPDVPVLLEALVLVAGIAYQYQDNAAHAMSYLERALDLAAPEGHVRPFLSAGMLLVKPLRQAIVQGMQPAFAQKLLAALSNQARRQVAVPSPSAALKDVGQGSPELMEPLTEREAQVLRLLTAGLTSTEVAEELVIAVSTARSYIKTLYGKLGVHSRNEAIERGRQAGLL